MDRYDEGMGQQKLLAAQTNELAHIADAAARIATALEKLIKLLKEEINR